MVRGWRECLDLICAIILATAGLMLAFSVSKLLHSWPDWEHSALCTYRQTTDVTQSSFETV